MTLPTPLYRIAVLALVALAIALRLANFNNVTARTPDEHVYTQQAKAWLSNGHAGLLANMADYESNPATRQYPAPTRVGMIRLVAAAMKWTGRGDDGAGAIVSCAASIASAALLALLGLRFFPPPAVLFALLFNAVSPMQLTMARRAWPDSPVEMLGLTMVYAACEISAGSRRLLWYILFAIAAGAGITIKEYTILPIGICALWILCELTWREALAMIAFTVAGIGVAVWWLSGSVGGLSELIRVATAIPAANAKNAYALEYASGSGYLLLAGLWIVTPVPAVFSLAGLWSRRSRLPGSSTEARLFQRMTIFVLLLLIFAMLLPHWLNLRYVAPAFGPFYLLAGLGFARVFTRCRAWLGGSGLFALAVIVLLVLDAGVDYMRFRDIFVDDATPDLSIKFLLDERFR